MSLSFLLEKDLKAIGSKGIRIHQILGQLETFRRGTKPLRIIKPARVGDGIVRVAPDETEALVSLHDRAAESGRMLKFVPASGVASRMFKDWYRWYQDGKVDSDEARIRFLDNLARFAFYEDLGELMASNGEDVEKCIREGRCTDLFDFILTRRGLNYASLPKALLKFHTYPGHTRTALEEHLVEAALYVRDARKICRIHFTVSEEHASQFENMFSRIQGDYENLFGVKYQIAVTAQSPSTDTITVDAENRPFRDKNGDIIFWPGGHGALLKNLNAIDGDIIFIKNIDNVVPDRLKEVTVLYKKILGGYLIQLQDEIFRNLKLLAGTRGEDELPAGAVRFCEEKLFMSFPDGLRNAPAPAKKEYVFRMLNRPIRVCGMVKNEGEPGGGPFWVEDNETLSLQIVEQNQLDLDSQEQSKIWNSSTHFNPVDLVCGVRNYTGEKFDLNLYVDAEAVFISKKSHEMGEVKTLELPGLWNGSMAFWNTVFVEVPVETFHPVKTIDDLLRKAHLP